MYIGEAESIQSRLKQHLEKDFWNHVIYFTSKDENLTKSHIRYLEGRLIELAKQAGRASLTNSQATSSKLPESDRADMEIFLKKIEQLLPALGVEVLVPIASEGQSKEEARPLFCEVSGLKAQGHLTPTRASRTAATSASLAVTRALAPELTTIALSPSRWTAIMAMPLGTPGVTNRSVVSTPSASSAARSSCPASSSPRRRAAAR